MTKVNSVIVQNDLQIQLNINNSCNFNVGAGNGEANILNSYLTVM